MKKIRAKLKTPWLEGFLAVISAVIGLFAGKFIEAIVPPIFQLSNLPYVAFILIAVLFLTDVAYTIILWRSTQNYVADVESYTHDLAIGLGHRVKTIPYAQGYDELLKRIESAEIEILILTEYVNIFDWENQKPIWHPERLNSPNRKAFYETLQKKIAIERENDTKFEFSMIVQIPENHLLSEMLPHDKLYKENCEFVVNIADKEPERARLKVTNLVFNNSIILIDHSFAHISFDVRNLDNSFESPFVMLIDDPKSDALKNLVKLYKRVEHRAGNVRMSDLKTPTKAE
jgi:hypothetical protein